MTQELPKAYDFKSTESRIYAMWEKGKYFKPHNDPNQPDFDPNVKPFIISIPPPNVTGELHLGHAMFVSVEDLMIRYHRMKGYSALWVPGTDHAGIATQLMVERELLRKEEITREELGREKFLERTWEWKKKYGGMITNQIRRLGASCDWDRERFTMDEGLSRAVREAFVRLYEKGMIYRGPRLINWSPGLKTAVSDLEVEYSEEDASLYYFKYMVKDSSEFIPVATIRPETILGDTAVAVHPEDERFKKFIGKTAIVPMLGRDIPIIGDEYVSMEFGTGALKITPAHDPNDYAIAQKHNLPMISMLDKEARVNENGGKYQGLDRFEARKQLWADMKEAGLVIKTEPYRTTIPRSQRGGEIVEPMISEQWFVRIESMANAGLDAVKDGRIKIVPERFEKTYFNWLENIKDWCISRQLWWGHRIPAWYDAEGKYVVAADVASAKELYQKQYGIAAESLKQDEDCLDTWFSSWLWPFEVFKGYSNPGNADEKYYYPTNTLVTAPEIIFFWVARMIMAGFEYKHEKPFNEVYFTGIVRDKQGRKMSKSLGNSPDLLEMIDKDGADAVRFGIMISSPAGNDLMWDPAGNEQGRFFINKMWNAMKLVKLWEARVDESENPNTQKNNFAISWFENRLNETKATLEGQFKDFRLSEALKTIYSLIWDDFCSWYLEWVKPPMNEPIAKNIYRQTIGFFEELVQLLHPFMPFITEEIYHSLQERKDDLAVKQFSAQKKADEAILQTGEKLKEAITAIRDTRNRNQLKPKDTIKLFIQTDDRNTYQSIEKLLAKQVNAEFVSFTQESITGAITLVVGKDKFYIQSTTTVDTTVQKQQLQKELEYLKGFLASVDKKLSNEKFVQNAKPEVIVIERKKKEDAELKIKVILETLTSLHE